MTYLHFALRIFLATTKYRKSKELRLQLTNDAKDRPESNDKCDHTVGK